jgi:hypothetical protein
MNIGYNLDKIKFATDKKTFQRAVDLYNGGKVTEVESLGGHYTAVVQGTQPYRVSVSAKSYKQSGCTCYVGERGTVCKHVIALALHVVMDGKPLDDRNVTVDCRTRCSMKAGILSPEDLAKAKEAITFAMRYVKPYSGPSKTWFANQDSLQEGCNRLSAIVSELPVSKQSAELLVKLLLRLDKKLRTGVDDSNGIVWPFMNEVVQVLIEYTKIDSDCIKAFKLINEKEAAFDWQEPLVAILDETISNPQ